MSALSDDLKRIADKLDLQYFRSLSMEEANVLIHYSPVTSPILLYDGISPITTEFVTNPAGIDNYDVEIYILNKVDTKDEKAEDVDTQLDAIHSIVKQVLDNLYTAENIPTYKLEGVQPFDDLLIGYKITAILPYFHVCQD